MTMEGMPPFLTAFSIASIASGTVRAGRMFSVSIPRNRFADMSPDGSPTKTPVAAAAADATVLPALLGP